MRLIASLAACLALLAACASPPPLESDWQRAQETKNWHEDRLALPPYPKRGNLVEFIPGSPTDFRFYVDPTSLSVGPDGVVRYVLVARSPQGAESVSYEGLRCSNDEYKIYATGGRDRHWIKSRGAPWRPLAQRAGAWRQALANDYFCPGKSPIANAAEGIEALKRGGNPRANILRNQPGA